MTGDGLRLGEATADLDAGHLRLPDGSVRQLRPKTAAMLRVLAGRPGRLFSKDELLAEVWPGVTVDEDALVQCAGEIRRALGQQGRTILRTHPKRGYSLHPGTPEPSVRGSPQPRSPLRVVGTASFVLALVVAATFATREPQGASDPPVAVAGLGDAGPVVAVFPFDALTEDVRWDRLARGLTQDLIADLAQNSWLFVLADATTRGRSETNLREAAGLLGASYLVAGAVQAEGDHVLVTATLSDVESGRQLWSKRLDAPTEDLLSLQRATSEALVGELASNWSGPIAEADRAKARGSGIDDLAAYELYLMAGDRARSYASHDLAASVEMLWKAVRMEPSFGEAWAKLSLTTYNRVQPEMTQAEAERLWREGDAAALEAYRVSPDAPYAIGQAANVVRWEDPEEAERMVRRAASLAPNNADILAYLSFRAAHFPSLGPEAEGWIERAMRLNPDHPDWYDWNRGAVMMVVGRYAEAAVSYAKGPDHFDVEAGRIAALALSGEISTARTRMARLVQEAPAFTIARHRDAAGLHPSVAEVYARGLKLAGAPER